MAILMLDDNEWTIYKLREVLSRYDEVEYISTLDDAIEHLKEHQPNTIITDFHIDDLDGKRFMKLVKGDFSDECNNEDGEAANITFKKIAELDPEIAEVIEKHFKGIEEYRRFVEMHRDAYFVLFSATKYGDGDDEPVLDDVFVAQKNNKDQADYESENSVRDYLLEIGAITDERTASESDHIEEFVDEYDNIDERIRRETTKGKKSKLRKDEDE